MLGVKPQCLGGCLKLESLQNSHGSDVKGLNGKQREVSLKCEACVFLGRGGPSEAELQWPTEESVITSVVNCTYFHREEWPS